MITAKSIDTSRPNDIVVFKEASEHNTSTLSSVLKRAPASGTRGRVARVSLLQSGESGVMTRVAALRKRELSNVTRAAPGQPGGVESCPPLHIFCRSVFGKGAIADVAMENEMENEILTQSASSCHPLERFSAIVCRLASVGCPGTNSSRVLELVGS